MRKEIVKLITENNSVEKGLLINIKPEDYADKLLQFANIIPYYESGEIKAFIAFYANDPQKENAFLTLILVSPEIQGQKIGRFLLDISIKILQQKGFKNYSLEVLKDNYKALELYQKFGFEIKEDRGLLFLMTKIL